MARRDHAPVCPAEGVPHACGDGPLCLYPRVNADGSSPRLWGWPAFMHSPSWPFCEFPTPVGMARSARTTCDRSRRVPHACGDGPVVSWQSYLGAVSSPRLWGWPGRARRGMSSPPEFPTPVGMARARGGARWRGSGVPHACGDGPPGSVLPDLAAQSSPRLWGWPGSQQPGRQRRHEFPTPVGMARQVWRGGKWSAGVPHACGDGPGLSEDAARGAESSPRLWGWPAGVRHPASARHEFPTPVGMARMSPQVTAYMPGVPHACGDGPTASTHSPSGVMSSPRLWGWPGPLSNEPDRPGEFPTPVGMARPTSPRTTEPPRVPPACGDGPLPVIDRAVVDVSSLRLWGWPDPRHDGGETHLEFPTPVGMARQREPAQEPQEGVPHACGDGPGARPGRSDRAQSSPRLWGWPAGER